jgi:hypothetical protein
MGDEQAARAVRFTAAEATAAPMRARRVKRRRVLIADARDNGRYLRTTWHAEDGMFVLSTWAGEVCTGAVRIPVDRAPDLINLLVDGLGDAAASEPVPPGEPVAKLPTTTHQPLDEVRQRVGQFGRWLRGLSRR